MPHDDDDHHQEEEQQRPRLRRTKTIAGDEDVQELALGAEDTIERPNNAAIAGAMTEHLLDVNERQWGSHRRDAQTVVGGRFLELSASPPAATSANVRAFIERLNHDAQLTVECNVCALIYVIRFMKHGGSARLTTDNWRPILSTAFLVASKVWDDLSMLNKDFSIIFRRWTDLQEVNARELAFLQAMDFDVSVSASQYTDLYFRLRGSAQLAHKSAHSRHVAAEEDKQRYHQQRPCPPASDRGTWQAGPGHRRRHSLPTPMALQLVRVRNSHGSGCCS